MKRFYMSKGCHLKELIVFIRKKSRFSAYELVRIGRQSQRRSVPDNIEKPEYWKSGNPSTSITKPEIHSGHEIERIRNACSVTSSILDSLKDVVKVGITTDEIDKYVHDQCIKKKVYPSPLNYKEFPKSVCTSVNNVACHGIPDDRQLADGDIVNIDVTVYKDGVHGDSSRMYLIGNVDEAGKKLCKATLDALNAGIGVCKPGVSFDKIGQAIDEVARKNNFTVIPCFTGHGIGSYFHGPPDIYHFHGSGTMYKGVMDTGMIFTIEPVLGDGSDEIEVQEDGWTAVTVDGSRTAQWEHTVLVTKTGVEILTKSHITT